MGFIKQVTISYSSALSCVILTTWWRSQGEPFFRHARKPCANGYWFICEIVQCKCNTSSRCSLIKTQSKQQKVNVYGLDQSKLPCRLHNYHADHWKRPHSYILSFWDYGSYKDARTVGVQCPLSSPLTLGHRRHM